MTKLIQKHFSNIALAAFLTLGSCFSAQASNVEQAAPETLVNSSVSMMQEESYAAYTGVIIDARGYGLEGTFSPLIYDTNNNIIYGADNIDKERAISQGMVEYSTDLTGSIKASRVGSRPLVIRAVATRSGINSANKVNVVISSEDAEKLVLADKYDAFLSNMAVVFVK